MSIGLFSVRRRVPFVTPAIEGVRALLHRRSMIPAPWIYLAAAGLGLVLGVTLDVWLGWPWWAVALGVLAAVWLLFVSSAFIGPARRQSWRQ